MHMVYKMTSFKLSPFSFFLLFRLALVEMFAERQNFSHASVHRLQTPNDGKYQKYLKNWADGADKKCFGRT